MLSWPVLQCCWSRRGSEVGEGEGLVSSSLGGVNKVQGIFSPCRKVYVLVNFWKHTP